MNEDVTIEQRVSCIETQLSVLMGVMAMALTGTKAEKKEAVAVLAELDKVVNPSVLPNLEQELNANPTTSG